MKTHPFKQQFDSWLGCAVRRIANEIWLRSYITAKILKIKLKPKRNVSYFYLHFCSFLSPSYLPLFLSCLPKLDSVFLSVFTHSFPLLNCFWTHSTTLILPLDLPPKTLQTSYLLCYLFPPPSSFFYPRKTCPSIAAFPSSFTAHSPPTLFRLFLSCAKGNHPWKMFWPSIIAASRMFPISLTAEPRAC